MKKKDARRSRHLLTRSALPRKIRLLDGIVPFALFALLAHFCVRLATTPTHPHHTVNRSTHSLFQDAFVLLRKAG